MRHDAAIEPLLIVRGAFFNTHVPGFASPVLLWQGLPCWLLQGRYKSSEAKMTGAVAITDEGDMLWRTLQ